jgi:hypothetical protein
MMYYFSRLVIVKCDYHAMIRHEADDVSAHSRRRRWLCLRACSKWDKGRGPEGAAFRLNVF